MKLLIIYNSGKVISVSEHLGGITYTAENVLVETKAKALEMLQLLGVDCAELENYDVA
jgi:hypothetical protein